MVHFSEAEEREYQRQLAREIQRAKEKAAALEAKQAKRDRERQEMEARRPIPKKDQPRCGAKTRAGGECQMRAEPGKKRCRLHGGKSTGPKTPEGIERIRAAQARRWAISRQADAILAMRKAQAMGPDGHPAA